MNPTPHDPAPPGDVDRLLSAFFKEQVPDPFPPCRALATAEPSSLYQPRRSATVGRSQIALAASVAALLGLGLFVSSGVRTPQAAKAPAATDAGGLINGATANGTEMMKHMTAKPTSR